MSGKRMFEYVEGTSSKFWEVWVDGTRVLTRYGKIGAHGQTTIKDEGDAAGAARLYERLVREKTGKGYVEKGAADADEAVGESDAGDDAPAASETAPPSASGARRFEFVEGDSSKFWEILVEGDSQTVRYGRIGTDGQSKTKRFASEALAMADTERMVAEKVGKGYVEVAGSRLASGAPTPAPAPAAAVSSRPKPKTSRRFEFRGEDTQKYWEINVERASFTVHYGELGQSGHSKTTECADEASAKRESDKLIAEKVRKGFVEASSA